MKRKTKEMRKRKEKKRKKKKENERTKKRSTTTIYRKIRKKGIYQKSGRCTALYTLSPWLISGFQKKKKYNMWTKRLTTNAHEHAHLPAACIRYFLQPNFIQCLALSIGQFTYWMYVSRAPSLTKSTSPHSLYLKKLGINYFEYCRGI